MKIPILVLGDTAGKEGVRKTEIGSLSPVFFSSHTSLPEIIRDFVPKHLHYFVQKVKKKPSTKIHKR